MLDRLLKLIVVLTLALFLGQAVIGLLIRLLEGMLTQVAGAFGRTGGALGGVLFAVAGVAFLVGLLVRGIRWLREGGVSGRPHRFGTTARQEWAGRGSADEVPTHQEGRANNPRRTNSNGRERG